VASNIYIHEPGDNMFAVDANILVCPVNRVGVMGKGLAKVFANKSPLIAVAYGEHCDKQQAKIQRTRLTAYQVPWLCEYTYILFAYTKDHWRQPSKIEWVDTALQSIARGLAKPELASTLVMPPRIAIPALGCGEGGLRWADVLHLMQVRLSGLPDNVHIHLFPPHGKQD
jgi:hypothetical protein